MLRFLQTQTVCTQQFLSWMKMAKGSPKGKKTLWEKEKLLITSNFPYTHNVFKRHILQTGKNKGLFGKGLNCQQQMLLIWTSPTFSHLIKS